MTPSQRAELRRLAGAAEEWAHGIWPTEGTFIRDGWEPVCVDFLAAANPQAVIGLLDYIDRLEDRIESLNKH